MRSLLAIMQAPRASCRRPGCRPACTEAWPLLSTSVLYGMGHEGVLWHWLLIAWAMHGEHAHTGYDARPAREVLHTCIEMERLC